MVVIRLTRGGAKKRPFYRIVVADQRKPRDGRFIERLGYYNPIVEDKNSLHLEQERVAYWIAKGAQPSERVSYLIKQFAKIQAVQPAKVEPADVEKETIINYNEQEPEADIFTYNKAFIKHLKTKMKLTPYHDNGFGGLSFKVEKSRLRFPQPKRQMSDKAKKASAARLAKARAGKQATAT